MIIGITGNARHGKDSVANFICSYRPSFIKYSFAKPMKEICEKIFGWSQDYIETNKDIIDPFWGISPRHVLQTLGTDWGQEILSKYDQFENITQRKLWVKCFFKNFYNDKKDWVIADVRFPHEVEEIRNRNGLIVKVFRKDFPVNASHYSERCVLQIQPDYFIFNDKDLVFLRKEVSALCYAIFNVK
jgi:hypothetical protein